MPARLLAALLAAAAASGARLPPEGPDVPEKAAAVEAWLRQRGAQLHASLRLQRGAGGAGLRAAGAIAPSEELAVTPLNATLRSWMAPPRLRKSLAKRLPDTPARHMVALALGLLAERALGQASPFAPYVAALPGIGELPAAVTWPEASLARLPRRARLRAGLAQQSLRHTYDGVLATVEEADWHLAEGSLDWPSFLWAYGVVCSRSFNATSFVGLRDAGDGGGLMLFPGGDLLNHHPEASVAYVYEPEIGAVAVRTLAPILAGEEAFNNYGGSGASNEHLLLGWGFLVEPKHDALWLPLPHPPAREGAAVTLPLLRALGLASSQPPEPGVDDPAQVLGAYRVGGSAAGTAEAARGVLLFWCAALATPAELGVLRDGAGGEKGQGSCCLRGLEELRGRALEAAVAHVGAEADRALPEADRRQLAGLAPDAADAGGPEEARLARALRLRATQQAVLLGVLSAVEGLPTACDGAA